MGNGLGMRVTIRYSDSGNTGTLNNVTEVHYGYESWREGNIAFESDIHGTGITYNISDIAEFECVPATEIEDEF